MATKRMLIDASHPEETRVAIVNGKQLEDFDVEVESRRQLRGNIYLAKVTRVEPSLQAAFVDYGGNRHGFLAFSEIHPDYYQIPVADRKALLAEQKAADREAAAADGEPHGTGDSAAVETVGGDVVDEVEARRPVALRRKYKIQEVIKRRQILLIQVVKEERGTKGAALTTYLSLAGRYCVLMPNTARGGGISRKISTGNDRKKLKSILNELKIPDGMAVIVRTAGQKRSKAEIKRDYEYLMRVWTTVRDTTLESMAPCLVHEEGNLIKRSIRDLYGKDIDEVVIDGEMGYRTAKDFMKMLIPSHTKRVQPFKETNKQLFQYYNIEEHLAGMHSPEVQLKSGGYIVINPTEALVSIDVNSGRATRGRNIEETALKTNLEAADEIARQLKLRDLAGLIVIDFIDMEENRNQISVERRLKDAMRSDRARIQIGRISPFGLLELSRQRLRPSLIETSSESCPYCEGTGIRRSTDSAALHVLRAIEDEGMQHRSRAVTVYIPTTVAIYIINHHRTTLADIESKFEISVTVEADDSLIPPDYRLERVKGDGQERGRDAAANDDDGDGSAEDGGKRRRRRRGRRRRRSEDADGTQPEAVKAAETADDDATGDDDETHAATEGEDGPASGRTRRRRRGRRGGRRRGRKAAEQRGEEAAASGNGAEAPDPGDGGDSEPAPEPAADAGSQENEPDAAAVNTAPGSRKAGAGDDKAADSEAKKPAKRTRRRKAKGTDDDGGKATKKPARKRSARKPKRAAATPETPADDAADGEFAITVPISAGAPDPVDAPGPAGAPAPVTAPQSGADAPMAAETAGDTAKTTVIDVDGAPEKDGGSGGAAGRKGWWSRP